MAEPAAPIDPQPPNTISLRAPSKYLADPTKPALTTLDGGGDDAAPFVAPPLAWLRRTWAVTHSTLRMWRSARNVRITYRPYKPEATLSDPATNDNLVEYEKRGGGGGGKNDNKVKRVEGIEKPDPKVPAAWTWRGKGLLAIASSHWEVLGWGERPLLHVGDMGDGVERWAVTWFAPTLFTQEGVDIYSDRREGLSKETVDGIIKALRELKDAPKLVELVKKHMQEVEISLPWKEGKGS